MGVGRSERRTGRSLLKVGVAVALLFLVVAWAGPRTILRVLGSVDPLWLLVLGSAALLNQVFLAFKWYLLLRSRGVAIRLGAAVRLVFVGYFIGIFTPAALGGDVYRVAELSSANNVPAVASTLVLERAVGMFVLAMLSMLALPFWPLLLEDVPRAATLAIILGAVLIVSVSLASLHPGFVKAVVRRLPFGSRALDSRRLQEFYAAYAGSQANRPALIVFAGLTTVHAIARILIVWLGTAALGFQVSVGLFLVVMPAVQMFTRLPLYAFDALGVMEGLLALVMIQAGYSAGDGVALSLLMRFVYYVVFVPPAALMLARGSRGGALSR